MPSTGFIKPISVTTTGTVENANALLDTGDAKLTGNGAFVNAIYPSFDIPSNATITGITFKTRITPISISTLAIFEARLQIDAIGGSVTLSDSSTSLQQVFISQGNVTFTQGQAIDIEHTFNSSNSTVNTVDEDNDIIQQLIGSIASDGFLPPQASLKFTVGLIDPSDPVADVVQINCGTESPVINIEYSLPPPAKVKITNSTKVLLKTSSDSGARGAVNIISQENSQPLNPLLNGVAGSAPLNPNGFAVLSDIFSSTNPEGEFTIPEDATNIKMTVNAFGLNVSQGDVRFKYTFTSGTPDSPIAIEKVGSPGIQDENLIRTHNDVFIDDGFTPFFWNNLIGVKLQLDDSYPFSSNYLIVGVGGIIDPTLSNDDVDPSFRLTFGQLSKVTIK